jgi:DEAD/DEAH box helicase domain-containing protein
MTVQGKPMHSPNDTPLIPEDAPPGRDIAAYVAALLASERLGHLVVHHRILPATPAVHAAPVRPFSRAVTGLLAARGIPALYSHQATATDLARAGRHVAVATPTASGKTMTYLLPVLEEIIANPDSRAIFLYPLKALAQDQQKAIRELAESLPESARPTTAIYDGDTTSHFRRKIRDNPPHILITNPEMLHLSLLPNHENWSTLFAGLSHVVVDEMHTYRGVMGSHMAHVFRRLIRVCRRFGAQPTFVFSSATIGNPGELAEALTGLPVTTVTASGAPTAARHFLFLNPEQSAATTAVMLLAAALKRGLRTIVYTQSRKMTELISLWIREKAGPYASRVSAYRSGFLPEERRDIEAAMASGNLLGVVSTSALELGIDIGGLDLCILCGYPGSVMSAWQRGGRVGRAGRESAVVLIAGEDALDQYFMRHPGEFFDRPAEAAVINPANPAIAAKHLECAAAELPLEATDPLLGDPDIRRLAEGLEHKGLLLRDQDGSRLFAARKRPHRDVNLRGAGGQFTIEAAGSVIGQIDELRAYKETHPGAVYIHRGVSYLVASLDIPERRVVVTPGKADYYTRARGQKTTEILEVLGESDVAGVPVFLGRLKVTETVTGYERRRTRGGQLLSIVPLDLPPMLFETEGLWWVIPTDVQAELDKRLFHFMGAIHAMEHAMIGILPLLVLTDRNDLGGISTPLHPQVGRACVFVYDGAPGGVGLSRLAFAKAGEALSRTLAAVAGCACETGCPSCVHSPKCGSGNRPIDKVAARYLLELLMSGKLPEKAPCRPDCSNPNEQPQANQPQAAGQPKASQAKKTPARYGVLDVETRRAAADVGGWGNAHKMGISVAVLYDSGLDDYITYTQDELPALYQALAGLDLIVGFNILRFDYKVLAGASPFDHRALPTLDILERVHARLGYRLSLDGLAKATLGAQKSATGLDALAWWKEGRIEEITTYCKQDVAVTRDLYTFGRDNGYLLFSNKAGKIVRLPVEWE